MAPHNIDFAFTLFNSLLMLAVCCCCLALAGYRELLFAPSWAHKAVVCT